MKPSAARRRLFCAVALLALALGSTRAAETSAAEVNLARAEQQGIPTASDSIDGTYQYQAGAFADGKSDTAWVTGREENEHWARIQWRNRLVTVRRVEIDFAPLSLAYTPPKDFFDPRPPAQLSFRTGKPDALELEVLTGGRWVSLQDAKTPLAWKGGGRVTIAPPAPVPNVQELRLTLRSTRANELFAVRELEVFGPKTETSFAMRPKWKGIWIWGELEPILANLSIVKRYFRRVFDVEDPAKIRAARLAFMAHDRGRVWLNGAEVLRTSFTGKGLWPELARKELDLSLLRKGKNVLAIQGEDLEEWGLRGVLAELALRKDDGSVETIATDGERFRAGTSAESGWNLHPEGFDSWKRPNPLAPANVDHDAIFNVAFTPLFLGDPVRVLEVKLDPAIPKPGDRFTLSVRVGAEQPLHRAYGVLVDLGEHGPVRNTYMDFSLGEAFLKPADGLPQGFQGEKTLSVPGFWPKGTAPRAPITLRFCAPEAQAEILSGPVGQVTGDPNPGALRVEVGAPPPPALKAGFPEVKIAGNGGLVVEGRTLAPMMFTSSLQTPDRYQDWLTSGVQIFRIPPQSSLSVMSAEEDEEVHLSKVMEMLRVQVETIRSMAPDAKFLLMLDLDAPTTWVHENPEELIMLPNNMKIISQDPKNKLNGFMHETPNSEVYLRRLRACTRRLVERLQAQPFAHSILGVVLTHGRAGENYEGLDVNSFVDDAGEWVIPDRDHWVWGDVGLAARRDFRDWLRAKYHADDRLAAAWKMSGAKFDDLIGMTAWPNKKFAELLMWRNRPKDRFIFRDRAAEGSFYADFVQHQNEANAELFLETAKVIKESSGGKLLVSGFIGYNLPNLSNSPPGSAQHSGHSAIRKVFESPYMDFIHSPHYYHLRRAGDPVMPMGIVDSLRLHGKLWVNEFDSRTYLSPLDPKTFSPTETREVFRKEFGYAITKNQGWWWLEFPFALIGPQAASWFSDPRLLADIAVMKRVYDLALKRPATGPSAECAVIFDAEQPYYTDSYSPANTVGSAVVNFLIPKLFKVGPPFDLYAQSDLSMLVEKGWHKNYKLLLFVNAYHLTKNDRTLIETRLKKDGRTLAFFFAPGYLGNDDPSAERSLAGIEEVTGMKGVRRLAEQRVVGVDLDAAPPAFREAADASFDVLPWWGPEQIKNYHQEIGPIFSLDPAAADGWTALGRLRMDRKPVEGRVALAVRKAADHQVFYSTLPDLPLAALREIVAASGVHSYTSRAGILTWANKNFLCVHAGRNERGIALDAGEAVTWIEPFDRKIYAKAARTLTLDLRKGETKFFCLDRKGEWQALLSAPSSAAASRPARAKP
ncbi:MAG: hypothetical protein HUU04_07325 [Verrucomicrobiae bacterium]|nr:hypothetical protein [Verrucomicrobiae bacterium]